MAECSAICFVAFLIMFCASQVRSAGSNHQYKAGDTIPLYANKAGPFHNPSETYAYNDLPYCSPDQVEQKKESLGEVLNGYRLVSTTYKLDFLVEKESEVACKKKLTKEEVSQFRAAFARDYYFQMYYDDLPIWAFIGKVEDKHYDGGIVEQYHLYTHLEFEILYNKGHVIEITLRTGTNSVVDLSEDEEVEVEFTYTVRWKETDNLFEKRIDKYLWYVSDEELFDNQEEEDGKASMVMFFGIQSTSLCLLQPLVLAPNYSFLGSDLQAPCRTTKCPREIPTLRWYRGTLPQMAVAGILPYGVIYVETYYLLASIWGHRIYTICGILLIVFIILIIVTVFVTVALTYFQLAAEDHEWWWSREMRLLGFVCSDLGFHMAYRAPVVCCRGLLPMLLLLLLLLLSVAVLLAVMATVFILCSVQQMSSATAAVVATQSSW
ncbi:hypothetical protein RHGRI_026473 [Rhododendron griersonianum]|uniref:Transmembrane 9 superfamily member n=1 Tax=Rhododendron griersonianum TaxID=479676 RepID=A0AAV6IZ49_9ERIC|nr:hypothetical protein RHGRI_026473 [Rhododendron griersonianum]KAG5531875.1 hypothetical protein RHGRI_026473 [Rhododendron griersonianum]